MDNGAGTRPPSSSGANGCGWRPQGERKAFTWTDYRDLSIAAHRELAAPVVWVWDNLNIHLAPELADFADQNKEWLKRSSSGHT
jgi:hypothetical protein